MTSPYQVFNYCVEKNDKSLLYHSIQLLCAFGTIARLVWWIIALGQEKR